jgi:nanoRNase/pAp phosphatase (c-di-AMP/oligoRNAs hydrolase)
MTTDTMSAFIATTTPVLSAARRIWMFMHVSPDLDAVGAHAGALAWVRQCNPTAPVCIGGGDYPRANLLAIAAAVDPHVFQHIDPADVAFCEGDVVVLIDVADIMRTSHRNDWALPAGIPRIVIDHHVVQCDAPYQLIDASYQSASALVYDLMQQAHTPLTQAHMACLVMGVLGDSGFFRFLDRRLVHTLALVQSFCERYGVDAYYQLVDLLERNRPAADFVIQGAYLHNLVVRPRYAYTTLTLAEVAALDLPAEALNGVNGASLIRNIADTEFVFVVKEHQPGMYRSSWRTCAGAVTSVRAIVAPHGGGGHDSAAGYSFAAESMAAAVAHLEACIALQGAP